MDSNRSSSCFAFFLSINLLFFALVSGCNTCSQPHPPPNPRPSPSTGGGSGGGGGGGGGSGGGGGGGGGSGGGGGGGGGGSTTRRCPRDALKLGVCANLLNGAIGAVIGTPPVTPCCSLLQGLVDLEVAVCLCTAIRANILGINLNIPLSLSLLVNICGNRLPPDFQC